MIKRTNLQVNESVMSFIKSQAEKKDDKYLLGLFERSNNVDVLREIFEIGLNEYLEKGSIDKSKRKVTTKMKDDNVGGGI